MTPTPDDMLSIDFPLWIPPVALVAFALIWLFVSMLTATVGGWLPLARRYPEDSAYLGREIASMGFRSLRINFFGNYRAAVNLGVYEEGLSISVIALFRFMHPPIQIPWHAVVSCDYRSGLFKTLKMKVDADTLTFFGKAAQQIWVAYSKHS